MAGLGDWQAELDFTCKSCPENLLSGIKNCSSDEDRLKFVKLNKLAPKCSWINDYLEKCHSTAKNCERSKAYKDEGNRMFQKRRYQESIKCYSQAVVFAPAGTETMSMAFGNRSAALFHQKSFKDCLSDIEAALTMGMCPDSIKHKLYMRKANCLKYLGHLKEFQEALYEAEILIDRVVADTDKKDQFQKEINNMRMDMSKSPGQVFAAEGNNDGDVVPKVYQSTGNLLVQASSAVEVQYNGEQGRFLTATQPIHAGDTLIVEKPFAAVLLPDHYPTHCNHCFTPTLLPFPCSRCVRVVYCSLDCMRESWRRYHGVECDYLLLLQSVGVAHLSLRIVLEAGLKFLAEFRQRVTAGRSCDMSQIAGVDESGQYGCTYNTVYHLLPHSEHMAAQDLLQYSLTADLLLRILQDADWFAKSAYCKDIHPLTAQADHQFIEKQKLSQIQEIQCQSTHSFCEDRGVQGSSGGTADLGNQCLSDGLSCVTLQPPDTQLDPPDRQLDSPDIQLYIGGLLLRHIQQLVCNAHAITEVQVRNCLCLQKHHNPSDRAAVLLFFIFMVILKIQCINRIHVFKRIAAKDSVSAVDETSQVRVATAIYPTASLMNHSCDPTIISSFHKDILIVRAVKDVPMGGEIFNCYGPHCKRMSRSERQQCLKEQYFFTCQCHPCLEGEHSEKFIHSFRCKKCDSFLVSSPTSGLFTCSQCDWTGVVDTNAGKQTDKLFQTGLQLMEQNNLSEASQVLDRCYTSMQSLLYRHNIQLSHVRDCLAKSYAMAGNFPLAAQYLEENMFTIEAIYGSESIETAHELQKLSEVLISAHNWTRALTVVETAAAIFTKHYGRSHDTVKELLSARNELLDIIG